MAKKTDFVFDEQTETPQMETTQNENIAAEVATSTENEVALALPTNIDLASLMASSSDLDDSQVVMSLRADYWEAKVEGDYINSIFLGFGESKHKDASGQIVNKKCVKLLSNKQVYINSGTLLCREFENAGVAVGTKVRVRYDGEKKLENGKAKVYSLHLLA